MGLSGDERRRSTRNMIEETFARYEPSEEAPPLPSVEGEVRPPPPEVEAAAPIERPAPGPGPVRRLGTGISGLDIILGGGLPDQSIILVIGESGSHYTTFVEQVLFNHLLDGGKVAYYLAEEPSIDVKQDMAGFGWNLDEYLANGSWVFVNVRTVDLQRLAELSPKSLLEGLSVNVSNSLNNLKSNLLERIRENRWTALQASHLLHYFKLRDIIDLMLYWRMTARVYGGVHFALLPDGVHPEREVNALKHLADGVFEFRLREAPRELEGVILVRKLRKTLNRPKLIPFDVVDTGLVIETAERIA